MSDNDDDRSGSDDRPYDVGYGKPPRQYMFAPGKSGNPDGRRKRSRSLLAHIQDELDLVVVVRSETITKREFIAKQMVNGGMKMDAKAIRALLPFIAVIDQKEAAEDAEYRARKLSKLENDLLAAIREMTEDENGDV